MTAALTFEFATEAEIDADIEALQQGAARWAAKSLHERAELMKRTHAAVAAAADEWTEAAVVAKGTPRGSLEGEEWMSGPYASLSGFAAAAETLEQMATGKSPAAGLKAGKAAGGRTKFRMLPSNLFEYNLFHGFSADLWLTPGVGPEIAVEKAGLGQKRLGENGGVGLVLGAGNISAIGPLDVLYELLAFNRVSVLKLNPTFGGLTAAYEKAFAPLIEAGVLRIVNGAAEVGQYLTSHPGICHVHITGSGLTHDMIVFGSTTDKSERKLDKPISSELGGVSPIIVVPGNWSKADLRFQAEHVVTQRLHNGGHNCIAGQALILSQDWAQKDDFIKVIGEVLASLAPRDPWYPGTEKKIALADASYPEAAKINGRTLVRVDGSTSQDLLTTEYFGPVLGYTELPGMGAEFFASAVKFANERLDGTLGASIIVKPSDRKKMGGRFEGILADLHYGTIGVNVWSAIGFLVPSLSWGAYPGNTLENVGSGIGIVHNAHLLEDVERSVLWGPFRPAHRALTHGEFALSPKPAWFVTAKTGDQVSKRLTRFAAKPGWGKLPGIFAHAFKG